MTIRIAMLSGPRNISTAMMRSWENRSDTEVVDEPFYANFLDATGFDHPGRAETLASQDTDAERVGRMLCGTPSGGSPVWYQKHMTHHLRAGLDRSWMQHVVPCFLIRQPDEMLASLHAKTPCPTLEDTGLPQQVELFDAAMANGVPPVIDARDVLERPRAMLSALCDVLGLPFEEAMLSWPAGPRDSDGAWAPYWYDSVWKSTGFQPWSPKSTSLPESMRQVLDECERCYDHLHQHRITV